MSNKQLIPPVEIDGEVEALGESAAARRKMLLKGVSRGAGVLVVAAPLQALATLPPGSVFTDPKALAPQRRCGISGMTSGVHSRDTTTTICIGRSPGWWGQSDDGVTPRRTWPLSTFDPKLYNEKYDVKFPRPRLLVARGQPKPSLFTVVKNYANSPTRHWICAYLNGLTGGKNGNFPYTGQQVLDFYNGIGPYSAAAALDFFKTYMETDS